MFRHSKSNGWIDACGYRRVRVGGRDVLEHRLIMEEHLGRKLKSKEVVDHIDGNKTNNSISNLRVCASNKINTQYYYGITEEDERIVSRNLKKGMTLRASIIGTNIKSPATALRIRKEMEAA